MVILLLKWPLFNFYFKLYKIVIKIENILITKLGLPDSSCLLTEFLI